MTRLWLLVLAIVVVLFGVVVWMANKPTTKEGFLTVDLDTATAQRQQLQFEGERRYNDLARVQAPPTTLDADTVAAALQTGVAVPSAAKPSLLGIVNSHLGLGVADDGSGKTGSGVEQTGLVAQKIAFCESLAVDCSLLDDPRAAECGMCHRDGLDSKGNAHRGGLYISSDDQIRANNGGTPLYTPTVGKCDPRNFTLISQKCTERESQLVCQSAAVPTSSNPCGQCYGAKPQAATGLVYMGPKPLTFDAVLWLTHPGMHHYQGTGTIVTLPNGSTVNVPYSNSIVVAPVQIPLKGIKEGDNFSIKVFGVPLVWAAWLSSPDGTRTVSIDVGLQNEAANPGLVIAGDKNSQTVQTPVKSYAQHDNIDWQSELSQMPNNVMWFARRDEILGGGISSASYGDVNGNVTWVTGSMKGIAGAYQDVTVSPQAFGGTDPSPGVPKMLTIWLDNGQSINAPDNTVVSKTDFNNSVNLQITVPATLANPLYGDDIADCPTGPIVTTAVGAGLMGSHSCFNPDGSFNPSVYCLQELFQAAGGTQKGTLYPTTADQAKALVAPSGTLDDTVAALNNLGSIALYGQTSAGSMVDFATIKDASLKMLGTVPGNPCDGPLSATGPHSTECLDYLWRTSGASVEPTLPNGDPTQLPYQYCTRAGTSAPILSTGAPNDAANAIANQQGGVSQVRAYYNAMFTNATQGGTKGLSADQINAAMKQCMGTSYQPPPPKPWDQCMPEVFAVRPQGSYNATFGQIGAICQSFGAQPATFKQLTEARQLGAEWCSAGWVADSDTQNQNAYYPMQTNVAECGGGAGVNSFGSRWLANATPGTGGAAANGAFETALAGVNCFGQKPPAGTPDVINFNATNNIWSAPPKIPKVGMTISLVPAADDSVCLRHQDFGAKTSSFTVDYNWKGASGMTSIPDFQLTQDASFKVVAANNGLGANYVSFEAVYFPNYYLRHVAPYNLNLVQKNPDDVTFNDDSTFAIVPPVQAGVNPLGFSIQSSADPTLYISYYGGASSVYVGPSAGANSVWRVYPALNGAQNLSN
jgi:hypothetical protein